jgi:arylformamidase
MRHIDLSHTVFDGLITYKGLPAPVICDYLSREASRALYAPGTEFQIGKIEMVANTGTYLDVPFHRFAEGKDLSEIPLAAVVDLPAVCVDVRGVAAITEAHLRGVSASQKAVLLHTGWAQHWNTPAYFEGHPFLTEDGARYLRDQGALLVGIDSHNIDDTRGGTRPAHTTLLGAGILIAEHLCGLQDLPASGFWFTAAPPKFRGVGTFPVRAYATLPA